MDPSLAVPLPGSVWIPSPHHRAREQVLDTFVLHAMGEWVIAPDGVIRHCTDLLRELELSVHAFCLTDGRIVETVPCDRVARHARSYNDRSIGMEFVVAGVHDEASLAAAMDRRDSPPYTDLQYTSAGRWFGTRARQAGLSFEAVRTHAELDPARKTDPGSAFDMARFEREFRAVAHSNG